MSTTPLGPDLILLNGKVFTSDPACRYAHAVAIKSAESRQLGTNHDIAATADAHTQCIDLGGRTVIRHQRCALASPQ